MRHYFFRHIYMYMLAACLDQCQVNYIYLCTYMYILHMLDVIHNCIMLYSAFYLNDTLDYWALPHSDRK